MTHCRLEGLKPRSLWIDGSATFTIVASRMTMNCARQMMTRTSQRLVSPAGGGSTGSGRSRAVRVDMGPPGLGSESGTGGGNCAGEWHQRTYQATGMATPLEAWSNHVVRSIHEHTFACTPPGPEPKRLPFSPPATTTPR